LSKLDQYGINTEFAQKCIEANKHSNVTTTYYLELQKFLKNGGKSNADISSEEYKTVPIGKRHINNTSNAKKSEDNCPAIADLINLAASKNRPSSCVKTNDNNSGNNLTTLHKGSLIESKACTGGSSSKETVTTQICKIKLNNTYESSEIGKVLNQVCPKNQEDVHLSYSINEKPMFEGTAPVTGCSYLLFRNLLEKRSTEIKNPKLPLKVPSSIKKVKKLSINMGNQNKNNNAYLISNSAKDQRLEKTTKITNSSSKNRAPINYNNTFYQPENNKSQLSPKNAIKFI